ncbi:MAG: adenosylcobinamide-phosphate synthase CbiB [Thermoleophilia bacterium]
MRSSACKTLALALALDLSLGEPPEALHPVCWMGRAVTLAERVAAGAGTDRTARRAAGAVTAVALPAGVFFASRWLLGQTPAPLTGALEAVLLYTAIAARSLGDAAAGVESGLADGLESGRERVSHMVGRDTAGLDEAGVVRAAVESVAENANDGVVAPLFWAVIGGAPLALAYRMVNTLDSMIGYRNERYRDLGWAAARLDDAAGYIPARITALAVAAAGPLVGTGSRAALSAWRRDGTGHASPNAGVCESAFAGALGVRLGGVSSYGGRQVELAPMGSGFRPPRREDIGRAVSLMYATVATATVVSAAVRGLAGHGWRGRAASVNN